MRSFRFPIATTLLAAILGSAHADDCDLNCHHGTTCVEGTADFSSHPQPHGLALSFHEYTTSPNGYKCECPQGLTGLACGHDFQTCRDGTHHCYHGGRCIPGLHDRFANEQLFCDCTGAVDQHGVEYVGKYCEIPKPQPCDPRYDRVFCVNGSTCRKNFKEFPHKPCHCGPNYDGQHCEFETDQVPECTLDCHNGGECRLGYKSYTAALSDFEEEWKHPAKDDYSYQYCSCPHGFFGDQCEREGSRCGAHHCFNGAQCVEKTDSRGHTKQHCDCTTASKAHSETKHFGGKYCQYESTSECRSGGVEPDLFCFNEGKCNEEGSHLECECPEGFGGPMCEYHESEDVDTTCKLECKNGGTCRKGVKDLTHLDFLEQLPEHLSKAHDENFEHCACPEGFFGLQCEVEAEHCDNKEASGSKHVCLHGSKCSVNFKSGEQTCDCDFTYSPTDKYAGKYCQFKSSEICTEDGEPGVGKNNFAFCVNGGKCKAKVGIDELHRGCDCEPGFTGVHCEVEEASSLDNTGGSENSPVDSANDSGDNGGGSKDGGMEGWPITLVTLSVFFALAAALFIARRRKRQHLADEHALHTQYSGDTDETPAATDPNISDYAMRLQQHVIFY